ncbi:hypothetical protein Tco_0712217, partial [Tanacetum coccineum]
IMEYLVKVSKKARILELKRRNMKKTDSDIQYAVSIKEDTSYLCLHFTKDHEGNKINTPYPVTTNTPYSSYGNKIFWKISNVDLAEKKSTKLVKYQSSGILCVICLMSLYMLVEYEHVVLDSTCHRETATLPPEWSKFVTDVKLVRDLHTTNIDKLHAYLGKHEFHANEVRLMHERNSDPLALQGDDPIDAINHMMSFLSAVVISRYPTTNNQLRNSSNPRQQATINDGRVTLQPVQGRQISFATRTSTTYTPGASGSNIGKQRTIICYNCKGEGHISRNNRKFMPSQTVIYHNVLIKPDDLDDMTLIVLYQTLPKLLSLRIYLIMVRGFAEYVKGNYNWQLLDSRSLHKQDALILSVIEQLKTQVVNCTKINMDNKSVNVTLTAELERYKEQVKVLKEEQNFDLKSKDNVSDLCEYSVEIDHLKQTLSEHVKEKESLMQTRSISTNYSHVDETLVFYDHTTKQALGFQNPFYLKKAQQLEPKLYDGNVIKNTNAIVILDSEETLVLAEESRSKMLLKQQDPMMLEKKVNTTPVDYAKSMNSSDLNPSERPTKVEVPKELPKVSMVNTSLKKLKTILASFGMVVKDRTTATTISRGARGALKHTIAVFRG